jgi:hypothetical protein
MNKLFGSIALLVVSVNLCASVARATPFDSCDFNIKLTDGRYEFVWKPTGAHRADVVLVLPSRFKGFVGNSSKLTVRNVPNPSI